MLSTPWRWRMSLGRLAVLPVTSGVPGTAWERCRWGWTCSVVCAGACRASLLRPRWSFAARPLLSLPHQLLRRRDRLGRLPPGTRVHPAGLLSRCPTGPGRHAAPRLHAHECATPTDLRGAPWGAVRAQAPGDSEGDDTPTRRTHRPAGARSAHHAGAQHHPSLQRGVTLPLAGVTRSPRRTGQGPSGAHHAWWARLGEVCGGPLEPPPVLARRRVPPPPRPRPHDAGQGGAMTAPGRP
jgi:hypothetical protein